MIATLLVITSLWASLGFQSAPPTVSGVVRDESGGVVAGALVVVRAGGAERQTATAPDGRFSVERPAPGDVVVIVRAGGFAETERRLTADAGALDIVLRPATLLEAVTVTASRGASGSDAPGTSTVLTRAMLDSTAAPMLDDQLKSVPGFSLFRRSSSRVANPTTQGVTMRGLSASGASRGLVIVDGVPLNDAFGGWIYWDRVPQTALDRVEIARGGSSDLYGADAVGGVIQVLTLAPSRPTARASVEIASRNTPRVSLFGGGAYQGWSAFASGEWQRSDGFVIVAPEERGPVDTPAASSYRTAYANIGYQTGSWHASVRGNVFEESRLNGTPLTTNNTASRSVSADLSGTAAGGVWIVRGYGGTQGYDQSFSAVVTARTSESLTQRQHVPSRNGGATAQWSVFARRTSWTIGADVRHVSGSTEETPFSRGVATGFTSAGGVQWDAGLFGRAEFAATDRLTLAGSARVDRWSSETTGDPSLTHGVVAFDPKVGAAWRAGEHVTLHALALQAFRTPTLNELYRSFRVGNTVTAANDGLQPEGLTSVEGGITVNRHAASLRVVGFWSHLADAVTNVTQSSTPSLITRQRQNAGTIRAAGAEIEGEWQIAHAVRATVGAELVDSVFADSQEPGLAGNRVPQVPRTQASAGLRVSAPGGILATLQLRFNSSQFDDDRNQFLLGRATVFDVFASRPLGRGVQIFGAVENTFNDAYDVGRTPTRTIGLPRTLRGGIRAYLR